MNYGKTLRAVSVFMLVVGIFSVITGGFITFFGSRALEISDATDTYLDTSNSISKGDISVILDNRKVHSAGDMQMMSAGIAASGIILLIYGILNIIRGYMGFNTVYVKNYTTVIVLGGIGILVELFSLFTSISDGSGTGPMLVKALYLFTSILYIYCANVLRIENDEEQLRLALEAVEAAKKKAEEGENGENSEDGEEDGADNEPKPDENRIKTIDDEAAEFFK